MSWQKCFFPALLIGIALSTARAQIPVPVTPPRPRPIHPRQEPCWEVAGIPKTAMEQRRALARQAREQIESVCMNSSLSMQQKREQIREIRMREKQQAEALITPQQQEAMHACQVERGHGPGGGGHAGGGRGRGPCGEMTNSPDREPEPHPKN